MLIWLDKIQCMTWKYLHKQWIVDIPREEILTGIKERKNDLVHAAQEYTRVTSTKKLSAIRVTFGELIFNIACLANSYGKIDTKKWSPRTVSLDEVVLNIPSCYASYQERSDILDRSLQKVEYKLHSPIRNISAIKHSIWVLLVATDSFVRIASQNPYSENGYPEIDTTHAFALAMHQKNRQHNSTPTPPAHTLEMPILESHPV